MITIEIDNMEDERLKDAARELKEACRDRGTCVYCPILKICNRAMKAEPMTWEV